MKGGLGGFSNKAINTSIGTAATRVICAMIAISVSSYGVFSRARSRGDTQGLVNWTEAEWPQGKPIFPSIDFFDSAVSFSTFSGLRLNGIRLVRCVAREVDFTGTDLSGADCRDTDFSASQFIRTTLTDTDFSGARNYVISPTLNTLKRTKFCFPEVISLLRALDIIITE